MNHETRLLIDRNYGGGKSLRSAEVTETAMTMENVENVIL